MTHFDHFEECMGTVFRFAGNHELEQSEFDEALAMATSLLHRADQIFSLYKPESPLSRLARGETSVAQLPPVVEEIWDECEHWERETDGWFSAFTPQNTFDPSGVVKTWAAKKAAEHLLSAGVLDFTVNAGGDVWVADATCERNDWRIGISTPVTIASPEAGVLTVVDLFGTDYRAMATSGSAERGEHIWNPKAPGKAPANELVQISVIAKDLVEADVWATAAFALGDRAISTLNSRNAANPQNQIQAIAVWPDGNLDGTEGFIDLLAKASH